MAKRTYDDYARMSPFELAGFVRDDNPSALALAMRDRICDLATELAKTPPETPPETGGLDDVVEMLNEVARSIGKTNDLVAGMIARLEADDVGEAEASDDADFEADEEEEDVPTPPPAPAKAKAAASAKTAPEADGAVTKEAVRKALIALAQRKDRFAAVRVLARFTGNERPLLDNVGEVDYAALLAVVEAA